MHIAPVPCYTSRRDAAPATTRTYRRLATWLSLRGTHRWTVVDARTFCETHDANPRVLLRTLQTGMDLLTALTAHGVVS